MKPDNYHCSTCGSTGPLEEGACSTCGSEAVTRVFPAELPPPQKPVKNPVHPEPGVIPPSRKIHGG